MSAAFKRKSRMSARAASISASETRPSDFATWPMTSNVVRKNSLEIDAPVTLRRVLDALEEAYPTLCGCVRDQNTKERRAFIRFFACNEDLSHDSVDDQLPQEIVDGREPLIVLGAIAGGCC